MLSLKEEYTLSFSNFLIIRLCVSSANFCFDIISLSIAPLEDLLSENVWGIETSPSSYSSYFRFIAMLNVVSCNTLSEAVLLGKS